MILLGSALLGGIVGGWWAYNWIKRNFFGGDDGTSQ